MYPFNSDFKAQYSELYDQILADFDAQTAHEASVAVRTKYMLALINRVHMKATAPLDLPVLADILDEEDVLDEPATQAVANARANALKASLLAHFAAVGTITTDGEHLAADTATAATLSAIAAASNLATSITLVNGLLAALNAHSDLAGRHFHDDSTTAAITTDPPTTVSEVIIDLNDLTAAIDVHYALASE